MRTCAEKFLSFFLLCLVILLHSSEADAFTRFHPPDGVYSIQPRCAPSAELSTANKGKSNGVNVLLAPISSSNPKWRITRINNTDWYKITVEGTNVGLNVDNGRNVSGTNITLWTYGGAWQQFCFWDIGEGDYYLIQGNIGGKQAMVLDVSGGTSNPTANVQSYGHNNTYAQQWKLVKVGATPAAKGNGDVNNDGKVDEKDKDLMKQYIVGIIHSLPNEQAGDLNGDGKISVADLNLMPETKTVSIKTLSDGWYQISPSHDQGRVLDVTGASTTNGTNLQTWTNGSQNNQKFYLQNRGNGYFSLKSGHCDLYITADGNQSGANLSLRTWTGGDIQLFQLIDGGNNVYHIVPKANTSLNFDCAGGWKNDGTNVQLWTRETASAHHKWKFTKTDVPKPNTNHNPEGYFDSVVSNGDHQITVTGWAFDRDDVNKPLEIHVYVGGGTGSGAECHSIIANKHRPDVNDAFPGVGNYHGFQDTINVAPSGNQPVHVYAINIGGGKDNPELGHKTVAIRPFFQPYERDARQTIPAFMDSGLTQRNGNERVDAGDHVTVLNEEGNSLFVDYPAGNTRKQRWVDKKIFEESEPDPVPPSLQNLINTWNNQTWVNHTYLKSVRECKEFASFIFNKLYGVGYIGGGSTSDNPKNYLINIANPSRVGLRQYKTNLTASSAQELFSIAQPGDFVQIRRRHGGPHSGIFVRRTDNGIVLFEANADGRNSIRTNTYSYSDLASKNYAMSLYYAK